MKTLGQIAHKAWSDATCSGGEWERLPPIGHEAYEAIGKAVRAAVIEECAKVCEVECEMIGQSVEHINGSGGAALCAEAIRSLK